MCACGCVCACVCAVPHCGEQLSDWREPRHVAAREFLTILLAVRAWGDLIRPAVEARVQVAVRTDSAAAMGAALTWRSKSAALNEVAKELCADAAAGLFVSMRIEEGGRWPASVAVVVEQRIVDDGAEVLPWTETLRAPLRPLLSFPVHLQTHAEHRSRMQATIPPRPEPYLELQLFLLGAHPACQSL